VEALTSQQQQVALKVLQSYLTYAREGKVDEFAMLLAQEASAGAKGFYDDLRRQAGGKANALTPKILEPLIWTGSGYVPTPTGPLPADVESWVKKDLQRNMAFRVTMVDGSVLWFRMERFGSAHWAALPEGFEEFAAKNTIAGLSSLRLDIIPRPGVRLRAYLDQEPGSSAVILFLSIDNLTDSAFSYSVNDFTLSVDGAPVRLQSSPHSPTQAQVAPRANVMTGNGWSFRLSRPTSTSTVLSCTPSDPQSQGRTFTVKAP
jgi:hypothetical protein